MRALIAGDREAFYASEIAARERAHYPPFGRLASVVVSGPDRASARGFRPRPRSPSRLHRSTSRAMRPCLGSRRGADRGRARAPPFPAAGQGAAGIRSLGLSARLARPCAEAGGRIKLDVDVDPMSFFEASSKPLGRRKGRRQACRRVHSKPGICRQRVGSPYCTARLRCVSKPRDFRGGVRRGVPENPCPQHFQGLAPRSATVACGMTMRITGEDRGRRKSDRRRNGGPLRHRLVRAGARSERRSIPSRPISTVSTRCLGESADLMRLVRSPVFCAEEQSRALDRGPRPGRHRRPRGAVSQGGDRQPPPVRGARHHQGLRGAGGAAQGRGRGRGHGRRAACPTGISREIQGHASRASPARTSRST